MIKYLEKKDNFINEINKDIIIVDFFATWCGPCKAMDSVIENIDFATVLKVNVDLFPDIAKEYGIMSIPTLCYFNKGELKTRKIGSQTLEDIKTDFNSI